MQGNSSGGATVATRATPGAGSSMPKKASTANILNAFVANPKPLKIMIGGDVMFDRGVRALGNKYGFDSLFASSTAFFHTADIMIANLEGPITTNPSKTLLSDGSTAKDLVFTFPIVSATTLATAGFSAVSLANNHMDNFGYEGYTQTKQYLGAAGVGYFGSPWNASSTELVITKDGQTVAFVGYHSFQKGFERIVSDVRRLAAQGDYVIVMPHWGTEYSPTSTDMMHGEARELVAAGASAVIGSHPHVIEDHEWIASPTGFLVPVYYSLGNLLFDQYFSPAVMKGNIIELDLSPNTSGVVHSHLDSPKVYETSTASRRGVSVDTNGVDETER